MAGGIERADCAITEISYQDRVRERPEGGRSGYHAPGRVDLAARRNQRTYKIAVSVEHIHLPLASAGLCIVLRSVLHRVGNVDLVADDMDAVWRETSGKMRIGEGSA